MKKKRRYLKGMYAHEYWEELAWPDNKDTLEVLNLDKEKSRVIFDAFVEVDEDNSGQMSVEEFHDYLGVPQTKFSARIFGVLDTDGSGSLEFSEFVVGVWNYCTYDVRLITKLAFDIFDVDRGGTLEIAECDALLRMVYDVDDIDHIEGPPSGPEILAEIDVNGDGEVTLDEFSDLMESHTYILAPAFDLQRGLRQKILGVKFWEGETRVRQALFSAYDSSKNDSWESIKKILKKSALERKRMAEEEEARKNAALSEEDRKKRDRQDALEGDKAARAKREAEAAAAAVTPEEMAAQEAAEALAAAVTAMDHNSYALDDLWYKQEARRALYEALGRAEELAAEARSARERYLVGLAEHGDAVAATDLFIKTAKGKKKLKYEMQLQFGLDMEREWSASTSSAKQAMAPMFKSLDGKNVNVTTAVAMSAMPAAASRNARNHAYELILDEQRDLLKAKAVRQARKEGRASERAYATTRQDLEGMHFGPYTKWEKLWDPDSGAEYWYDTQAGAQLWERPCVCDKCDELIDAYDLKCFGCMAERSKFNRKFYEGPSALPPLPPEEEEDDEDDEEAGGKGKAARASAGDSGVAEGGEGNEESDSDDEDGYG